MALIGSKLMQVSRILMALRERRLIQIDPMLVTLTVGILACSADFIRSSNGNTDASELDICGWLS